MAVKDTLKFYCCTLQGLLRLKLIIGLVLGLLIMLAAILTLINPVALINPFNYLRQVWNAVFGFLILAAQPGWQKIPICSKILGRPRLALRLPQPLARPRPLLPLVRAALSSLHRRSPLTAPTHHRQRRHRRDEPRRWPRFSFVIGLVPIFMAIVELFTGRYFDRKAQKEGGGGGGAAWAARPPLRTSRTGCPAAALRRRTRGRAAGADERHAAAPRRVEAGGGRQRQHVLLQRGDGGPAGRCRPLSMRITSLPPKSLARAVSRAGRFAAKAARLHVLHALGLRLGGDLDPASGHVTKRTSSPDATAARVAAARCRASPSRRCRLTGRTRITFWPASDLSGENSRRSLAAFQLRGAAPPVEVGAPREADDQRWPRSGRWASAALTRSPLTTTAFAQSSSVISSASAALSGASGSRRSRRCRSRARPMPRGVATKACTIPPRIVHAVAAARQLLVERVRGRASHRLVRRRAKIEVGLVGKPVGGARRAEYRCLVVSW